MVLIHCIVFLILLNCFHSANGAENNILGSERGFFSESAPIEITSEKLIADSNNHSAIFEGSVVAKQGKTVLSADWMEVTYNNTGEVIKILAKGGVTIIRENKKISSKEAEYYRKEGKIVFTGNPVANSPNNTISGTKIVYFIKDGRTIVENSKVIIGKKEILKKNQNNKN